jgi:hypothetical protein
VLEFLVAILAGLSHLQDISLVAHPLDKDQVVAEAWGQPGWADYIGISRTLSALSLVSTVLCEMTFLRSGTAVNPADQNETGTLPIE